MNKHSAALSEPVSKSFVLITQGDDHELDAIAIIVEVLKPLQGYEIARVLQYLTDRYSRKVLP